MIMMMSNILSNDYASEINITIYNYYEVHIYLVQTRQNHTISKARHISSFKSQREYQDVFDAAPVPRLLTSLHKFA